MLRNDRLLAVAADSHEHEELREITDLPAAMLHEIEHFFSSYNEAHGRKIRILRRVGPAHATTLLQQSLLPRSDA